MPQAENTHETVQNQASSSTGGAQGSGRSTANRRQHQRVDFQHGAFLFECGQTSVEPIAVACNTINLSRSGLAIRCKRPIQAERRVFVSVPLANGTVKLFFGVVRNARYAEAGLYQLGIEFETIPETGWARAWVRRHIEQSERQHRG
jgi:hypothetical protein